MLRLISALSGRRGITVTRGIRYGKLRRQALEIHAPRQAAADAPLLVFFHGGSWHIGDKAAYGFVGEAFASAGITVAIPNYRLYPEVTFPDFVRDGAAAVACALAETHPRRLFIAGHSAGAHIAALLHLDRHYLDEAGVAPGAVAGAIGLSGPYDFLPLRKERYRRVFREATREASQPIAFADGRAPPMLLLSGDRDRTVSPGNARRLAAAIVANGGEATVKIYPGVGHLGMVTALARILPYRKPPVRDDMIAFMRAMNASQPVR
ncbi:MAG TPA: alpha/beta hydrolase [Bauldia sp.]